jgi:hypothetical protein
MSSRFIVVSFLRFALVSLVASAAAGGFASCPGQRWYEKSTVLLHRALINGMISSASRSLQRCRQQRSRERLPVFFRVLQGLPPENGF